MTKLKHLIVPVVILCALQAQAADWKESPEVAALFRSAGINGTFVLFDVTAQTYVGHNKDRAEKRFVPASTFKIPNTLIGLSVGAVKSVDEVLPYRGRAQPFIKAWEKDMRLRDAIVVSNVPIYQELARRIGLGRMRDNVERMDFGNKEIGTSVDKFWLTGPLKISAVEQTQFLAKLAEGSLPFPPQYQESVREITSLEQGANWRLHGKTGWENAPGPGVGWWVGWLLRDGRVYSFALNMDIRKASDASKRLELGRTSLKVLGLL